MITHREETPSGRQSDSFLNTSQPDSQTEPSNRTKNLISESQTAFAIKENPAHVTMTFQKRGLPLPSQQVFSHIRGFSGSVPGLQWVAPGWVLDPELSKGSSVRTAENQGRRQGSSYSLASRAVVDTPQHSQVPGSLPAAQGFGRAWPRAV